jgi:16S rRNA C967 or C1407 C5-methylase (RsmB/RsmF family)
LLKLDFFDPAEPTGCVVANDADNKRAYMLVHQLRRINSPAVFVTTCDAQFFPLVRSEENPTEGIFDRVLCDVPCSGDGTSRKNPGKSSCIDICK